MSPTSYQTAPPRVGRRTLSEGARQVKMRLRQGRSFASLRMTSGGMAALEEMPSLLPSPGGRGGRLGEFGLPAAGGFSPAGVSGVGIAGSGGQEGFDLVVAERGLVGLALELLGAA